MSRRNVPVITALLDGTVFGERIPGPRPNVLGPNVLALHGWGRTRADMTALSGGRSTLAIDLPGFGASPEPPRAWSTREFASYIQPLLQELPGPVVVVGHSFGGRVALNLAAISPLVTRLILVGTPLSPSQFRPPASYRILRAFAQRSEAGRSMLERRRQRTGSPDYRNATPLMRQVLVRAVSESYYETLRALETPTVFINGEFDTAAPPHEASELAATMRDAHAVMLPGSGHLLDEQILAEVDRWISR